jgi:hypothetical protein
VGRTLKPITTGDRETDTALEDLRRAVSDLYDNAFLSGREIEVTLPDATEVTVNHGLGRRFTSYALSAPIGATTSGRIVESTPDTDRKAISSATGWRDHHGPHAGVVMAKYRLIDWQALKYDLMGGVTPRSTGLPCQRRNCRSVRTYGRARPGRSAASALASSTCTDGTTMATPVALARYQDKLVAMTAGGASVGGAAYEYASTLDRWTAKDASAGGTESPRVRQTDIAKSGGEGGAWAGDSATANGITLHAYEEHETSGANYKSSVKITITDSNGSVLKNGHQLFTVTAAATTDIFGVKCAVRGNVLYAFYYDVTAQDLMVAIVDATSAATLGTMSPTAISVATDINTTTPAFDVCGNTTYGVFSPTRARPRIRSNSASCRPSASGEYIDDGDGRLAVSIAVDVSLFAMHAIVHGTGVTQ